MCDDICYEMFRLQQALKPGKDDPEKRGSAAKPASAQELEQMKILQEQEGYQADWVNKNASRINFKQALQYFNEFFQE